MVGSYFRVGPRFRRHHRVTNRVGNVALPGDSAAVRISRLECVLAKSANDSPVVVLRVHGLALSNDRRDESALLSTGW